MDERSKQIIAFKKALYDLYPNLSPQVADEAAQQLAAVQGQLEEATAFFVQAKELDPSQRDALAAQMGAFADEQEGQASGIETGEQPETTIAIV